MNRDTRGPRSMGRSTRGGNRSTGGGGMPGPGGCLEKILGAFLLFVAVVVAAAWHPWA